MDWTAIVVAAFAAVGTGIGSWYGIRKSNDLIAYRMDRLEEKVTKHNHLVERMYGLEEAIKVCGGKIDSTKEFFDEKFKVANHRISDLEARK